MVTKTLEAEANYSAYVVKVESINVLDNCDNVVGIPVGGYQAIVSKDTKVGDLFLVFPAETQISGEFLRDMNLYSSPEENADPTQKGYMGKNRRVKAQRFRGHTSNALALSAGSLPFEIAEGEVFDTINGAPLCRKYVLPTKENTAQGKSQQEKAFRRVDSKMLPEHIDTENYGRNKFKIAPDAIVSVTQKLHGTSIRIGHTIVKRQLTWLERLAQRLGVKVADTEFDVVFGSRKVIKDANNPNQNHFYFIDIWSEEGKKYAHLIPKNVVVYGELVGWTPDGAPIQQGYTYDVPRGQTHLYIYRVAVVTADGGLFDLSWEGVKSFCQERGLKHVPELEVMEFWGFEPRADEYLDKVFFENYPGTVPLSNKGTVDEGICVRVEGQVPFVLKHKSPKFFEHESATLDKGEEILS